jgi:hypothetical protein
MPDLYKRQIRNNRQGPQSGMINLWIVGANSNCDIPLCKLPLRDPRLNVVWLDYWEWTLLS